MGGVLHRRTGTTPRSGSRHILLALLPESPPELTLLHRTVTSGIGCGCTTAACATAVGLGFRQVRPMSADAGRNAPLAAGPPPGPHRISRGASPGHPSHLLESHRAGVESGPPAVQDAGHDSCCRTPRGTSPRRPVPSVQRDLSRLSRTSRRPAGSLLLFTFCGRDRPCPSSVRAPASLPELPRADDSLSRGRVLPCAAPHLLPGASPARPSPPWSRHVCQDT